MRRGHGGGHESGALGGAPEMWAVRGSRRVSGGYTGVSGGSCVFPKRGYIFPRRQFFQDVVFVQDVVLLFQDVVSFLPKPSHLLRGTMLVG